ncbi:MAG: hypothetical protein M3176_10120 [Chloroflexota bacterium]|nr:hypothetical protein [Chloroflexota bacterium]
MATVPRTLESPEIATVNANGGLTGDQRRVLGRDLYRERGKELAASLGWIVISLVMLRILLPVAGSLVPMLFTDNHRGSRPVRFASATVTLPLWAMLKWFLVLLALAYVVAFCVQVKRLIAFLRLRHDLLHGPIASVVGEVRQRDGQSLAIFASRQVRPWDVGVMEGVAPGMYRLFLLPRFDWLLSAQRLRDWERPTADEEVLAARHSLAVINGFDPAALPDNRAGNLTVEQARWLRDSAPDIGWRIVVLFGFAIAVGVGGAVAYGGAAMQRGITRDRLEGLGTGIVWAAIWTYILAKQCADNAKQKRDADEGQVRVYEGVATKWEGWKYHNTGGSGSASGDSNNPWVYRYVCGDEQFEVSQAAFRALADGLVHRVYYTPKSKQFVNIELVPPGADLSGQPPDPFSYL